MISIHDLTFSWPGAKTPTLIIEKLEVAQAEQVFLQGPSGSGKSSLLSLLAGTVPSFSGKVVVLNQDWGSISQSRKDRIRADSIGVIFQQFNLLPYLSAVENVVMALSCSPARAQRIAASKRDFYEKSAQFLVNLGIEVKLHKQPAAELSVGQQQRVAAARALIGSPGLILADEPNSALDRYNERLFLDLLLSQCRRNNTTLIFVSHDQRLSAPFDRVVSMRDINRVTGETQPASSVAMAP